MLYEVITHQTNDGALLITDGYFNGMREVFLSVFNGFLHPVNDLFLPGNDFLIFFHIFGTVVSSRITSYNVCYTKLLR